MTDTIEHLLVKNLGDKIGYGRVMQLCEEIWSSKDRSGALTVGPCNHFMRPCPCENRLQCGICCSTGRVTRGVLELLNKEKDMKLKVELDEAEVKKIIEDHVAQQYPDMKVSECAAFDGDTDGSEISDPNVLITLEPRSK